MKLEKVKKTKTKSKVPSSGSNLFKKILAVLLSIVVFSGSFLLISKASADTKEVEEVLRIKAKDGRLPAESVLTMDNIEKYQIIRKEYTQDMVLAIDLEDVLEKYTAYYLRNGAILHYDEISDLKPLKNEWIYKYRNEDIADKEILSIPFSYLESGGDILTPGDRVRIRLKYEVEETEIAEGYDSDGEYYYRAGKPVKKEVTEDLFESIEVKDMLNSKGHSIYEVYREVLRYPESERQKLLRSSDFINNIVPKTLVLAATDNQVLKYMQFKSSSKGILITLLPRDESSTILDIPILEEAMRVWLENQK
jgi:hypothetical protein